MNVGKSGLLSLFAQRMCSIYDTNRVVTEKSNMRSSVNEFIVRTFDKKCVTICSDLFGFEEGIVIY